MGYAKRLFEEMRDPDRLVGDPNFFVCAECFADPALKRVIMGSATKNVCDHCGRRSRTRPIAGPYDVVIERIYEGLCTQYDDALNGVGWEGGFVGAETWDTHELVQQHVELSGEARDDLLFKIANSLPDRTWSETDPYGPRRHEILRWSWAAFVDTIKHERRYFFMNHRGESSNREEMPVIDLLESIVDGCIEYGLVSRAPPGLRLYRCRPRRQTQVKYTLPRELGPPPRNRASQSRMSPAGIPMFYGAEDGPTAVAETLFGPSDYALAKFETTRPTTLLNLAEIPYVSLFDTEKVHLYDWSRFMRGFIGDFQKPVVRNGLEHVEYVPTQIVTEYFRSTLTIEGTRLDGIRYRSTRRNGGICCVRLRRKTMSILYAWLMEQEARICS
ncbi:MAG: RES domain-containing protein [Hyphomicrobiales bacterium]|nr:RES domain-containing protein [Hyphomicrobiales bacterium]MBV8826026.1 RES domain-containing protein [Hyphomicrobiales bacterium]MBV9429023.1 RES domain-containing protein [Bradyrhizobiaceae bacterium]